MTNRGAASARSLLTASALAVLVGCSKGSSQQGTISRADTLLQQEKVPEAVAELQKAVAADTKDPQANGRLGRAQLRAGQLSQAYHYLLNSKNLQPNDPDVRLDLATYYLIGGKRDQASEQAQFVLDKDPNNVRALRLFAASASTREDEAAAIKAIEAAKDKISKDTAAHLAVVGLYLRKGDTAAANREQGGLADFSAPAPAARVARALDYVSVGRREDAKRVLREVLQSDPTAGSAARLLSALTLADANVDEATSVLAPVLSKDPKDVDAMIARGEARLVQKQTTEGMSDIRGIVGTGTDLAPAHYDLAVGYMQIANAAKARPDVDSALKGANRELQTALKLAPGYPEAILQLAALRTQAGAANDAVADVEHFIADNPRSVRARTILGSALLTAGRIPEADEAFRDVLRLSPSNAEAHYWLGMLQLKQENRNGAKAQFDTAATLAPTFFEPINQLATLMVADRNVDGAAARVKKQIDVAPSGALYTLLGLIDVSKNDIPGAEAAFTKAIQLDPRLIDPRVRLAQLSMVSGKNDEALANSLEVLKLDPNNTAGMMVAGSVYQMKGDFTKARDQYMSLLKLNPNDGAAANNLAVLLSEQGNDLDGALKYANIARQASPGDPHVADTLGWILYRRKQFEEAAKLLRGSADQLPDSPSVNYHFGMVAQQLGDAVAARQALTKAVSSPTNFTGKDEARKALAQLK